MRLISWNINGLRAVITKGFDAFLQGYQPDVLCLQEIKATPEQMAGIWEVPAGYHAIWNPAQRKGYSGTLILSREKPEAVTLGMGDPEGDAEGRVISARIDGIEVVCVYTPNAKGDLSRLGYRSEIWDPQFRDFAVGRARSGPVVLCGDFNVAHTELDIARPKANRGKNGFTDEERNGFSRLLEAGFVDSFREFHPGEGGHYSWWSYRAGARQRNIGWRLDYGCVSAELAPRVKSGSILSEVPGSDHAPVELVIR